MNDFHLNRAKGQALAEGVVILLVLIALWVSATWLFRLQGMALQATHAAGHVAFSAARRVAPEVIGHKVRQQFFDGPAYQWRTLNGSQWLSASRHEVNATVDDSGGGQYANSDPPNAFVSGLLSPWSVGSPQDVTGHVAVHPRLLRDHQPTAIKRSQHIFVGAGHGRDDADVLARLGGSQQGWAGIAGQSVASGQSVAGRLQPLDQGWPRPEVRFDWLEPWVGAVPDRHLQLWSGGGQ